MSALLSVRDLRIVSAAGELTHGINFDLEAGEYLALVGESGSGKTVTMLALSRLLPRGLRIAGGTIRFAGQEVTALTDPAMETLRGTGIAYVFQDPVTSLNPYLRVSVQVGEAMVDRLGLDWAEARRRTADLFDEVGLGRSKERLNAYPHELSGGMRQRVSIAMALTCEPKLLIADEPTTALDVTTQGQIIRLVNRLKRDRGLATIWVTHDLDVARAVSDRIIVLRAGEVVETGGTKDVFRAPRADYTRLLLASRPQLSDAPRPALPENAPVPLRPLASTLILEARNLSKRYRTPSGWLQAVDDVSVQLSKGETLAVVGESGSGKSTLGQMILGLTPIDSGSVLLHGEDFLSLRGARQREARGRLQVVFQDPLATFSPRMTIGTALKDALWRRDRDKATTETQVARLLREVGLPESFASRYPHELSGGQCQRVAIARALASEPDVIVCDECVSALDVSVQAQVLNLLSDIQRLRGLALLFITHDLKVVRRIADRIAVMDAGQLIESAPTAALFANPTHPRTRALITDATALEDSATDHEMKFPQRKSLCCSPLKTGQALLG